MLAETFTLSKAATTYVCSRCKECVLFALFSYHDPWSMEEPPDAANNIPLGPDTTGRGGAGGSLSEKGQAPQKWSYWDQTGVNSKPDVVTSHLCDTR